VYCDVLTAVLADAVIDPAEKRLLREYRCVRAYVYAVPFPESGLSECVPCG
jgi:hypothetical protein